MARGFCLSIDGDFITHVKTRKLCRLTKDEAAPLCLISLWSWAAEFAPDGDLSDIDVPEIEDGARYRGTPGLLFQALVDVGFIDEDHDGRRIHNWMKPGHTGYALVQADKARDRWRRAKGIPPRRNANSTEDSARNNAGVRGDSAVLHGSRFTVHTDPGLSLPSDPPSGPSLRPDPEGAIPPAPPAGVTPVPAVFRAAATPYPLGAITESFSAVFKRYVNQSGRVRAAQTWQETAAIFPGGEVALAAVIGAAFDAGLLKQHPFSAEHRYQPTFEKFLSVRHWEDPIVPAAARAGPVRDPKYGHAPAEKFTKTGRVDL